MRSLILVPVVVGFSACPMKAPPVADDGGFEEELPYEGEATGNIPDFTNGVIDAGTGFAFDAGPIVVETRCCKLGFRLPSTGEPSHARGWLTGDAFPLSQRLELRREGDAGYVANACVPINTSTFYWYELSWTTGDVDAGGAPLRDGGFLVQVERYSPDELNYPTGQGTNRNFLPSVSDCALLDAGTGP